MADYNQYFNDERFVACHKAVTEYTQSKYGEIINWGEMCAVAVHAWITANQKLAPPEAISETFHVQV